MSHHAFTNIFKCVKYVDIFNTSNTFKTFRRLVLKIWHHVSSSLAMSCFRILLRSEGLRLETFSALLGWRVPPGSGLARQLGEGQEWL